MGRRTSGGEIGLEKIGNVSANQATLTTTQANSDLILDPNGTGNVQINGSLTLNTGDLTIVNQGDLRLRETTANGSNYIAMQAAAAMAANYTITWPGAVAGTNGFVLSSDTSGNLSWSAAGGTIPVTDPGAVATVHYPLFATNAGVIPTTLTPNARSNLSFVPSTGDLVVTLITAATSRGSNASGGTLTLRGTGNATKATASILMDENVASTTAATGTLVVTGGVGISGDLNVGGTGSFTGTVSVATPSANGHATTKQYVDSQVGGTWTTISSSTTATNLTNYFVNTAAGAITLTLPASPSANNKVAVADLAGTFDVNNLTLGRNSVLIMGRAEDLIINTRNASLTLVYSGATYGWKLV